jgi:acyl-CoA hydrolase
MSAGAAAPAYTNTSSIYVNSSVFAEEIRSGTAGQLVYQSAPSVTDFVSTATTGNFLQANFTGAPAWTTTASMYVGNSVISTNIRAGTIGQLHYQSAADTTGFVGPGTAGQLLMSAGAAIPVYTNTASIYVNSAVNAQTLFGGTAGQLHYQSAPGVTAFMGPGTAGQILVSAGAAVPVYKLALPQTY